MVFGLRGRDVRFFFLLIWIPIPFRAVILPFLPSLSAGIYVVLGPGRGLLALGVTVAGFHLLVVGGEGWMWHLQWVAMGPIFVEAFSRSRSLERAMAGAVLMTLLLQGSLLSMHAFELGMAPWTLLGKGIDEAVRASIEVYGAMGMEPQTVARLRSVAPALSRAIAAIVPGTIIAIDLLLFWWTLVVHRKGFVLLGKQGPGPETLGSWGIPYPWVWVTIGAGILVLLPGSIFPGIGANLLIVMGTLHFLQGVGVIATFFQKRGVPRFIRGILYALIFFQQFFLLAVAVLGLFDIWFDFRRRWNITPQA